MWAFSDSFHGCASLLSTVSAWVECHNVPVSLWDIPKEKGKSQPPPTLPIHHCDTASCSHGKPTAGQLLWTRAGRGKSGGEGTRHPLKTHCFVYYN